MLTLPQGDTNYKILSIDPGTDTLGVSVIYLDLVDYRPHLIFATTLHAAKEARCIPEMEEIHGLRRTKLFTHQKQLQSIMRKFTPNCVICESPYMGRFPQAYQALVECMSMIYYTLTEYDPTIPLETVDPPTAKKAVGASGRGGDKDAVKRALLGNTKLVNSTDIPLEHYDEHTIDSIAVGCYKLKSIDEQII